VCQQLLEHFGYAILDAATPVAGALFALRVVSPQVFVTGYTTSVPAPLEDNVEVVRLALIIVAVEGITETPSNFMYILFIFGFPFNDFDVP
jgi:hypothetical protein